MPMAIEQHHNGEFSHTALASALITQIFTLHSSAVAEELAWMSTPGNIHVTVPYSQCYLIENGSTHTESNNYW